MREPVFSGACTALITPFGENGEVDYHAFEQLIETQIENGIDALCVCGTTGETPTLSVREYTNMIKCCVKTVHGRVKVIAGSGSNDTFPSRPRMPALTPFLL